MLDEGKTGPFLGDNLETLLHMNTISDNDMLACLIRLAPQHIQTNFIRQISPQEMCEIQNALGQIGDFDNSCNLYEICDTNYKSIMSFYSQIETDYLQNRNRADEFIEDTVQEMNRLLLNYLTSFKTFLDHLNTRYSRLPLQENEYLAEFNKVCSTCFDTNFYYRFFSKLRDYVQHYDLPVQYVDIKEIPNRIDISICFDRDRLMERFKKWKQVKKDLIKQSERIEIIPSLEKLRDQIQLINTVVTSIEISIAYGSYNRLCGLINEVAEQYPAGQPFIGHFERRNTPEASLQMTNFPFHQIRRFRDKYEEIQKLESGLKLPDH